MADASVAAQCEARIGRSLKGKWMLERILGVGGMAAVYVGVHKIGRRDAIKILHPEIARSKELNLRFEQEAHAVNKLAHPGAVEIRDIDVSEDGCPFLVMELLEGENLGERATRLGGIPVDEMLRAMDETLDVLAAAHARGIIHRDIKLDNLFVTTDGKVKVLDFGIARVRSGPAITMLGARLGTTAYMAPEQVQGKEVDARADIFAVGATMFRLVAKRRLHEAATEIELLTKMASMPAPALASVVPGVDANLALVVDRALAFHATERYPNALTMQGDIQALRERETPPFASARAAQSPLGQASASSAPAPVSPMAFAMDASGFGGDSTAAASPSAMASPASMRAPGGATAVLATPLPPSAGGPASMAYPSAAIASAAMTSSTPPGHAAPHVGHPMAASYGALQAPVSMRSGYGAPHSIAVTALPGRAPTNSKSTGLIIAIVGILGLLVVSGGALALFGFDSRAASHSESDESEDESSDAPVKKKKKAEAAAPATAEPTATPAPEATESSAPDAPTASASATTHAPVESWPPTSGGTKPAATTKPTSTTVVGPAAVPFQRLTPTSTAKASSKPTAAPIHPKR